MIIYQIKLPKAQDADAFAKFMREEYFPAVKKVGATRIGKVTDLVLLQRARETEGDDVEHDFFWHVGWNGQPTGKVQVDDEQVTRKFEAFKPRVHRMGFYEKLAS